MKIDIKKLIVSIAVPLIVGLAGSAATMSKIPSWYADLNKPFFSPPNWLFGPVWTLLYILMGIALYIVWNSKAKNKGGAIHWFGRQLVLNLLWSSIFFGAENPGLAFIEIMILWWTIVKTIGAFNKINKLAAKLLWPYLAWVSFASVLNLAIWWLNR